MNANFSIINNIIEELDQKRIQLELGTEENWKCLQNVCSDRAISERIYLHFEECSSDWKELVYGLIKEISYIRCKENNQAHQYLIQNGEISILKGIDISKEALILFGDGAEEIFVYQPNNSQEVSQEIRENLAQLLEERGISIAAAIKNCCYDRGRLIARLAKELQKMKQKYQDKIGLFYSVIQNGKASRLDEFNKEKEALFLISAKFEARIYFYQP